MKRYQYKRIIAAGMSLMMAASLLAGCGNSDRQTGEDGTDSTGNVAADGIGQSSEGSDGAAMGRYLEEIVDLSGSLGGYREQLFAFQDKIEITQPMGGIQVSKDCGVTWETEEQEWLDEFWEQGRYIDDYAIGADGTIGIVYSEMGILDEATGENMDGDESKGTEGSDDADKSEDSEDENLQPLTEDAFWIYSHKNALIVRPDGTQIPIALPKEEEEGPQHIWIADSGEIFVGTDNSDLYEIAEDGSGKVFLTLEDAPQLIQFQGSRMIIDGYGYNGLFIYDMDTKEYVEDTVLNDFVRENYGDRTFNGGSFYDMYFLRKKRMFSILLETKGCIAM